jgi:nucleoside-diphosphate-sugar epimerase
MKRVVLTGINGTVAYAMKKALADTYDISGLSLRRMDDVIKEMQATTWKGQLEAYRNLLMEQLTAELKGKDAVVHLGWNTDDENYKGGLDPLNILQVDCVYQAAIAENVSRIYMASSVHSYDYDEAMGADGEPIKPFPDTRDNAFGVGTTSLYGVSKRWMEIAGQFYAKRLHEGQKILCVRLGAVGRNEKPNRKGSRLWNSHEDLAGLLSAFIECDDAPNFWVAFGVSDNHGGDFPRPVFDAVNPYGFTPAGNAFTDSVQ